MHRLFRVEVAPYRTGKLSRYYSYNIFRLPTHKNVVTLSIAHSNSVRFANSSPASINFIESAPIESVDPLPQRFRFISFCDSKLTVASIHIKGLKTCMESQKSNMGSVDEAQSILANFIEIRDADTISHWLVLNGDSDWDCSLQNVLGIKCTTDFYSFMVACNLARIQKSDKDDKGYKVVFLPKNWEAFKGRFKLSSINLSEAQVDLHSMIYRTKSLRNVK